MKKVTLILIALLGGFGSLWAQKLKLSDMYLFGSSGSIITNSLSNKEIANLKSGLNTPTINKGQQYSNSDNYRWSSQVGMMAAWDIKGRQQRKQKLRIGFSAGTCDLSFYDYTANNTVYRIDTLVSSQTGRTTYIDSVDSRSFYFFHNATMLNVHIDYLRAINPQNKLSAYFGAGINLGMSLSNTMKSSYNEYQYVMLPSGFDYGSVSNPFPNNNYRFENDSKNLSVATNARAYSLLGVNYQLSKRAPLLKHTHVFAELKMGVDISAMEELNTATGFYYGGQGGLRVSLGN